MIIACDCGAKLKLDDAKVGDKGVRIRCPRCGQILLAKKETAEIPEALQEIPSPLPKTAPPVVAPGGGSELVLIANESESVRSMLTDILADGGFEVAEAADGLEALQKTTDLSPAAIIVDVGLPGIYGFELCERIKDQQKGHVPKILLLTSTYDVARYKREPASLYGADDYVEKHQVHDLLNLKIRRLIMGSEPEPQPAATPQAAAESAERAAPARPSRLKKPPDDFEFKPETLLRDDADEREPAGGPIPSAAGKSSGTTADTAPSSWLDTFIRQAQDSPAMTPDSFTVESSIFNGGERSIPPVADDDPDALEKAKRLVRIIVSDIALYNQDAVREGVRNGTFFELLRDDIEEGRQLYEKRVPASIRAQRNYLQDAFDSFIEAQKKIVR